MEAIGIVAQPEIGVPLFVVMHPGKSAGAILLVLALAMAVLGAFLFFIGPLHGLGAFLLVAAGLAAAAAGYLALHKRTKGARP